MRERRSRRRGFPEEERKNFIPLKSIKKSEVA